MINLKFLIETDLLLYYPLMNTDQFIRFCSKRAINVDRKKLEQLEKLGLFFPFARIERPIVDMKIEYVNDGKSYKRLGIVREDEKWEGEIEKEYATFFFKKEIVLNWMENYYSSYQCYPLYHLNKLTSSNINAIWWSEYKSEDIKNIMGNIGDWAKKTICSLEKGRIRIDDTIPYICQVISNCYYPYTQSDRRTIQIPFYKKRNGFNWFQYRKNWDAKEILKTLELNIEDIKKAHEVISLDSSWLDPLEKWYSLIEFISVDKKKNLKNHALLAQTFHAMEKMLRLFYYDLTGEKLFAPDEGNYDWKEHFYGKGIPENDLRYLEFLTNQYHLNPRPKLILIVEGDGEEKQIPRLAKELLGDDFNKVGIAIENLKGIDEFSGRKGEKLSRFIDHYHNLQTIVYILLDNENNASKVKEDLCKKKSKYNANRFMTKEEYIFLWDSCIEFDNFTDSEIASGLTKVAGRRYEFTEQEVNQARNNWGKDSSPLSQLYSDRLNYSLKKPKLLEELFDIIINQPEREFDKNGRPKRKIVKRIIDIINIALQNYLPISLDAWEHNQESGFIG